MKNSLTDHEKTNLRNFCPQVMKSLLNHEPVKVQFFLTFKTLLNNLKFNKSQTIELPKMTEVQMNEDLRYLCQN